jgi:hypothetical protein
MKLLTASGLGGMLSVTVGLSGVGPPPPGVRDLEVPRRAFAVASAQNATSEDRFVKSKRSFDVGDSDKVRDGNPILRRHLIGFLVDLYLVHRRLQFGYGISLFARIRVWWRALAMNCDLQLKTDRS